MPTIISHPAVALLRSRETPARLLVAGAIASIVPDVDVLAFQYHIPYGSMFGHRGITHSIAFAIVSALLLALILRDRRAFLFIFLCAVSHPLLDALTNGGRGVALLAPFSTRRFFAPWRPIRVSPIGALNLAVLWSEVKWIWFPVIAVLILRRATRRSALSTRRSALASESAPEPPPGTSRTGD